MASRRSHAAYYSKYIAVRGVGYHNAVRGCGATIMLYEGAGLRRDAIASYVSNGCLQFPTIRQFV